MTDLRTAAQQALEVLEAGPDVDPIFAGETEDALRAALAEPVHEPVAWTYEWKNRLHGGSLNVSRTRWPESHLWIETPLYAAPPQRKPLSEEEIKQLLFESAGMTVTFSAVDLSLARAIERAHGIK